MSEDIHLTPSLISIQLAILTVPTSFISYFTYAYVTMSGKDTTIGTLFLLHIIFEYLGLLQELIEVFYMVKHIGNTYSVHVWRELLLPTSRLPLSLLKISYCGIFVVSTALMSYFLPVKSTNCHDFEMDACHSMQIISVLMTLTYAVMGLHLLYYILNFCVLLCISEANTTQETEVHPGSKENIIKKYYDRLNSMNPIPVTFEATDCAICLSLLQESETILLQCGHTFHKSCIIEWGNISDNCPICRKSVSYLNTV